MNTSMGSPMLGGGPRGGWCPPALSGLAADVVAWCKEFAACNSNSKANMQQLHQLQPQQRLYS